MEKTARDESNRVTKILAGWVIDGTGLPAQRRVMITVKGERIFRMVAVAPHEFPPAGSWVDMTDCTLLPALTDCHVHLALSGIPGSCDCVNPHQNDDTYYAERITMHLDQHSRCGVIAVRDAGDCHGAVLKYKLKQGENKGIPLRMYAAGTAWHREGRYGKAIAHSLLDTDDAVSVIERGTSTGSNHIKIIQSGLNSLSRFGKKTLPQFDRKTLSKIQNLAKRLGIGLMIHANGVLPVSEALSAGCDSIEHGFFMGEENLKKMAEKRISWVPTAVAMKSLADHAPDGSAESDIARKTLDHQLEQLRRARQFGVNVALGTDAGAPGVVHGTSVWDELRLIAEAGYTVEEAIRCATLNASRLLRDDISGCLSSGKLANFIAVKGTPKELLTNCHNIHSRFFSGRELS